MTWKRPEGFAGAIPWFIETNGRDCKFLNFLPCPSPNTIYTVITVLLKFYYSFWVIIIIILSQYCLKGGERWKGQDPFYHPPPPTPRSLLQKKILIYLESAGKINDWGRVKNYNKHNVLGEWGESNPCAKKFLDHLAHLKSAKLSIIQRK